MPWLRLDDGFIDHPKIVELTDAEFRTHIGVLCYCARYRTGGRFTLRSRRLTKRQAERFLRLGLWEADEGANEGAAEDAYRIHDWAAYNTADASNAARQARFRARRNAGVTQEVTDDVTPSNAVTGDVTRNAESNDESNGPPARSHARAVPSFKDTSLSYVDVEVEEGGTATAESERERKRKWEEYAESRADVIAKAAYAATGFRSGEWPPELPRASSVNPETVARNWVIGYAWDETFTEDMVSEEFDRIERAHSPIPLDVRGELLAAWAEEYASRYPTEALPT